MAIQNGSILSSIRGDVAAAHAASNAAPAQTERKQSDFWLNIGVTVPDGKGGEVFVSLPVGLALDDMKPQQIKGTNADWIQLAQTKNALLEQLQKAAASLAPGDRICVDALTVELYRRNEPAQTGNAADNPLMSGLFSRLTS